ncbi:hypothetical protein [Parashewanella tropica]|uniref:hypothetical protein n=1 Tax=Parashewanella tropica TaxID=2547970 RepID=UPI001059FAD7|nr:hypothetical protein [Parashewanella tropica]
MKYPLVFISLLSLITLVACNDKQRVTSPPPKTYSMSGTVLVDPIQNAKVCTDCNQNMVCDSSERHTLSDEQGRYAFNNLSAEINSCPLLAEVTTDSINVLRNQPIAAPFKLASPAGCYNITPISTMLQYEMSIGYTKDEATKLLQHRLQTEAPLCGNYVSTRFDNTSSEQQKLEAKHLHQVANMFNELMVSNLSKLDDVLEEETQYSQRHEYIVAHQLKAISAMTQAITKNNYPDLTQQVSDEEAQGNSGIGDFPQFTIQSMQSSFPLMVSAGTVPSNKVTIADEMKILALRKQAANVDAYQQLANSTSSKLGIITYQDKLLSNGVELDYIDGRNSAGNNTARSIEFKLSRWQEQGFTEIDNEDANTIVFTENGHNAVGKTLLVSPTEGLDALIQSKNVSDYAYFINAKRYGVGGANISALLSSHHDLQVWPQVTDATGLETLPDNSSMSAFELTQTVALNFFELTCQTKGTENEDCGTASVLTPNTSTAYAGVFSFNYSLATEVENVNSIVAGYQFNIPSAPIVYSDENHYIIAWLFHPWFYRPDQRVRYFRVDKDKLTFVFDDINGIDTEISKIEGSPIQYLGSGLWSRSTRFGLDFVDITIPQSVQRFSSKLSTNMSFFNYQGKMRMGIERKKGQVIEQKQLGVGFETHLEILESINHDKLEQLIESKK